MMSIKSIAFALYSLLIEVVLAFNSIASKQESSASFSIAIFYNDNDETMIVQTEEDEHKTPEELDTSEDAKEGCASLLNSIFGWSRLVVTILKKVMFFWNSTPLSPTGDNVEYDKTHGGQQPGNQDSGKQSGPEKPLLQNDDAAMDMFMEDQEDDKYQAYRFDMDKSFARNAELFRDYLLEYADCKKQKLDETLENSHSENKAVKRWSQEEWLLQKDDSDADMETCQEEDDEDREYRAYLNEFTAIELELIEKELAEDSDYE